MKVGNMFEEVFIIEFKGYILREGFFIVFRGLYLWKRGLELELGIRILGFNYFRNNVGGGSRLKMGW